MIQPRCEQAGPPVNTVCVTVTDLRTIQFVVWKLCNTSHIWKRETDLLQELDLSLEDLLHVVDFLLSRLTASLQLCFIVIGQALCCCAVRNNSAKN